MIKNSVITLLLFCIFLAGCASNDKVNGESYPFPQHIDYHVNQMKPSDKSQEQLDEMIIDLFRQFLLNDLIVDSDSPQTGDEFRLVFRHYQAWLINNDSIDVSHLTVSESHGYGMMMLAYMAGSEERLNLSPEQWLFDCTSLKHYFDAMVRTVLAFPSVSGGTDNKLFAWELNGYPRDGDNRTGYIIENGIKKAPFTRPASGSSATDGDLDIIYALLLADKQWGSDGAYDYKQLALEMLESFWRYCVHREYHTLLLGDWAQGSRGTRLGDATRSSDFVLSHLRAFAEVDKAHDWQLVIDATYNVIQEIRDAENELGNKNGFLPDFVVRSEGRWKVPDGHVLEGSGDGTFAYNACRIPWRLGTDYILYGDRVIGDSTLFEYIIKPLDDFAKEIGSMTQMGPFNMDGSSVGWTDPHLFAPPFLLPAAITATDQDWLDSIWGWNGINAYQGDNYADYIKVLVLLIASGNYWTPY
ncbi:MAG: glycosyl hydrolase family 8 [Lachnospiraceae bacterium]|nr:glycosyl hydrolase family 8 [Lachnospiraceae bacterium]